MSTNTATTARKSTGSYTLSDDHTVTKNRSYDVRCDIHEGLARLPRTAPRNLKVKCLIRLRDSSIADAVLDTMDNAGFRGIEGWFTLADGERVCQSLGDIAYWEV